MSNLRETYVTPVRQNGFYWIRYFKDHDWEVAYYNGTQWLLVGIQKGDPLSAMVDEDDLDFHAMILDKDIYQIGSLVLGCPGKIQHR